MVASPTGVTTSARPRGDLMRSMEEFDVFQAREGAIGLRVFPQLDVVGRVGDFGRVPKEVLLREVDTKRAPNSGYNADTTELEADTWKTQEHGLKESIDNSNANDYERWLDANTFVGNKLRYKLFRAHELAVANAVFNTQVWTGSDRTTAVGVGWRNASGARPVDDVRAAARKVRDGIGMMPNALILSRYAFQDCRATDAVKSDIHSSGAGQAVQQAAVTAALLAQVFDLKYVFVGDMVRNTAADGATATPGSIWNDDFAMVARIGETNDIQEPCIGRTIHRTDDGSTIDGTVETYVDDDMRAEVIRVRRETQEKRLYVEAGHLLTNISSAS